MQWGILIARLQINHASKTEGVTISRIDPHYWGKYFWKAHRLLPEYPP
jgi:cell wall-associated NlpC family hydrolase